MSNEPIIHESHWREIVDVEDGKITRIKRVSAFDTSSMKFVTILGVDPDEPAALVFRTGTVTENDPNRPLRSIHFSWFRKDRLL